LVRGGKMSIEYIKQYEIVLINGRLCLAEVIVMEGKKNEI